MTSGKKYNLMVDLYIVDIYGYNIEFIDDKTTNIVRVIFYLIYN